MRHGEAIIISASVLGACHDSMAERLPRPDAAGRWQAATLSRLDAAAVRALPREGDTVVVALWATWCTPCIEEMPELDAFARAHPDVAVLGLATDADSPAAQGVLDRVRPGYTQAALDGGEGPFLGAFGLEWEGILPVTFVYRGGRAWPVAAPVTRARLEEVLELAARDPR